MKILELCLSPSLGGLELYMFRCSRELNKTNEVFPVINLKKSRLKDLFKNENLQFICISRFSKYFPLISAYRLVSIIDNNKIDIVHTHCKNDLPLAALAKTISKRKPKLIYYRQMKIPASKDDFYHNFLYSKVDILLVITRKLMIEAKKFLNPAFSNKIKHLYYGVDSLKGQPDKEQIENMKNDIGIETDKFTIGLFSRIEHIKGQHLLIEAIGKIKRDYQINIYALIVGIVMDNKYLQSLKELIMDLHIEKNIIFKDFVKNPQEWMQICDSVALTTYEETFGLVLIEAMHVGIPVIGSDRGGVPEIIDDGKTGLLFESGNADSLSEKIMDYNNNSEKMRRIALEGQKKAKEIFSKERHYKELNEIFKAVI